jgi:hypothetical protein
MIAESPVIAGADFYPPSPPPPPEKTSVGRPGIASAMIVIKC